MLAVILAKMAKITTFDSICAVCWALSSNCTCFWWALSSNSTCSWWALKAILELRAHQKHVLLELRAQQTAHFEPKVVILAIFIRITVNKVKLLNLKYSIHNF